MSLRNVLHTHSEKIWILALDDKCLSRPFSPLVQLIDWYNNQILLKSVKSKKIDFSFGRKTLISTFGLLPTEKLVLIGLGQSQNLGLREAKKFLDETLKTVDGFGVQNPWIIFEPSTPKEFLNEVTKSRTSIENLTQATISVD